MTKTLATLYINTDPLQGKPEITVGKSINYGSCHLRPRNIYSMFSPLIGRSTFFLLWDRGDNCALYSRETIMILKYFSQKV